MQINFQQNQSNQKELVPEGIYLVNLKNWKRDKASSGNYHIEWTGEIETPAPHKGKLVKDFLTLTDNASWRLQLFLETVLGDLSGVGIVDIDTPEFQGLLDACKGRKIYWSVIVDTWNGRTRNKTASKSPYTPYAKNPPFDPSAVEDVPEWVK